MKKMLVILWVAISLSAAAQVRPIDISKSTIKWTGKKVTGEHTGSLRFKEGALTFTKKKITAGTFTADMTTLSNDDQSGKDKSKLEGHLKSSDFFATDDFKTAKLVFKSVTEKKPNVYAITADLTIKGKTNPVKFDLVTKGRKATATFEIDRTKYGIKYGSDSFFDDLGDRTIYDDFEINVSLVY